MSTSLLNVQQGFGGLQILLTAAVIGVVSVVAVPKYNSFMDKAKITEAFNLAGESKRKLSQYFMVNNRFPKTMHEAQAMKTTTVSPPEFVRDMAVEPGSDNNDVMVKVYLKPGVVENLAGGEQYIYVAGNESKNTGYALEWSCGAVGIDLELLPEDCRS